MANAATSLSTTLLSAVAPDGQAALASWDALADQLAVAHEVAAAAWAGSFELAPEAFVAAIAERIGVAANPRAALARLRAADLYLAVACARGVAGAVDAFERVFGRDIDRVVARFARSAADRDDLGQAVRERLLVGAGPARPPRIASYDGSGFLQNWVRVTTTRLCIDAARAARPRQVEVPAGDDEPHVAGDRADAELSFFRRELAGVVRAAFADAVAELDGDRRRLLRWHVVDGLSIDTIAERLGCHRATAARRLVRARADLVDALRAALHRRDPSASVESCVGLVRSQLDVSLHRLLATREPRRGG